MSGGCDGATPPHPDRLPITSLQPKPDPRSYLEVAKLCEGSRFRGLVPITRGSPKVMQTEVGVSVYKSTKP